MESSLHTQTLEIRRRLSEHHLRVSGKRSLSRPNGHSGPVTGTFEQVHLPTAGLSAAKATAPNAAAAMIRKEIIMSDLYARQRCVADFGLPYRRSRGGHCVYERRRMGSRSCPTPALADDAENT